MRLNFGLTVMLFIGFQSNAQSGFYSNPVGDSLFIADPFILYYQDTYYLYGTSANDGFKGWISDDLVNWDTLGYVFHRDAKSWGVGSFWAPEVIHYQGKFYMIYSASGQTMYGKGLRLCLAESDKPEGPFKDVYAPLFDLGFSCIDGHIFIDDDDKPYLYYEMVGAVGEHWNNDGFLWGVIMGVELSEDLSRSLSEAKLCLYPSQDWEGIHSMKARSNEGMTVFKYEGVYYMTYSANHYADPKYGVGYATSKTPLGMWIKFEGNPILKNDLSEKISGPGHNCLIKSPDEKERFIIYHSHADLVHPSGRRILNIDRIVIHEDGTLSVKGPSRKPQPLPSGVQK